MKDVLQAVLDFFVDNFFNGANKAKITKAKQTDEGLEIPTSFMSFFDFIFLVIAAGFLYAAVEDFRHVGSLAAMKTPWKVVGGVCGLAILSGLYQLIAFRKVIIHHSGDITVKVLILFLPIFKRFKKTSIDHIIYDRKAKSFGGQAFDVWVKPKANTKYGLFKIDYPVDTDEFRQMKKLLQDQFAQSGLQLSPDSISYFREF